MEKELQNEQDCIHNRNFEEAKKLQTTLEEYLRMIGKPVNMDDTEVQQILDILTLEENIEED